MTVYLVTNLVNGKYYIGHTRRSLRDRWQTHQSEARTRARYPFHKDISQCGADVFEVQALAVDVPMEEARRLEMLWIVATGSYRPEQGYNVSIGYQLTAGQRAKMAQSRTGLRLSAAHREAVSRGNRGKPKSEAHRAALKAARQRFLVRQCQ